MSESRYGAKLKKFAFPATREYLVTIDSYFVQLAKAQIKEAEIKEVQKYIDPRPHSVKKADRKVVKLTLAEAKEKYAPKISTKTAEEVKEANRLFILNQKKTKEETHGE